MKKYFIALIGGVLYASGFPFYKDFFLFLGPLLAITILLSLLSIYERKKNLKRDLLIILCFALGYYQFGFYWIPYTLKEFGSIPVPANYLLGLLFSVIIIPQYIAFILLYSITGKKTAHNSLPLKNLFIAISLTLLERFIPQQFPAHVGHSYPHWAGIALAPILGATGFSFIYFWTATSLAGLIKRHRFDYCPIIGLVTFVLFNVFLPTAASRGENVITKVRMVQANIGNNLKISSEQGSLNAREIIHQRYLELSTQDPEFKPDLIIWPETAFPYIVSTDLIEKNTEYIPPLIREVVGKTEASLLFGGYDIAPQKNDDLLFEGQYNSAILINSPASFGQVYHKMKLIPFGETLPFGPANKLIAQHISNVSFFAKGEKFTLFELPNNASFSMAICYEILFTGFIRSYLNSLSAQPNFIVNLTNDSWYGDTSEPYQHLFLAKWRTLEFNIPIIRMTNTGISSIIYPDGTETKRLRVFQQGTLDIELISPKRLPTIYQQYGLLPLCLLWIVLLLIIYLLKSLLSKDREA